jgi:hypothetical protein
MRETTILMELMETMLFKAMRVMIPRGNNGDDLLLGDDSDDYMEGENGADKFSCGGGIDTITDFNAFHGDLKSGDCESSYPPW